MVQRISPLAIFLVNAPIGGAALLALPTLRRQGFTDSADRATGFDPAGLLLLTTVDTPLWMTAVIMAGRGVGIGLVIQPLLSIMLTGLADRDLADANTLFSVAQRLGGVALCALFLRVDGQGVAQLGVAGAGTPEAGPLQDPVRG